MPERVILTTKLKEERDYWVERLSRERGAAGLPADFNRSKVYSKKREALSLNVPGELYVKLSGLVGESPFLLYTTLAAALKVCLHKYTGSRFVAIGSPAHGGGNGAAPPSNALAIVDEVDDRLSFRELLVNVRQTLTEAYARQSFPFDALLGELGLEGEGNRCPLFDVALALEELHGPMPETRHDLNATFARTPGGLQGTLEYNARLFRRETVERFAGHFLNILEGAVSNSRAPVGSLEMLTDAEREQMLTRWNDTRDDLTQGHTVVEMFQEQARRAPDAVAAVFDGGHLTYGELNARSNKLARHLRALGVGPDVLVGLCLERSTEMVVAVLGVLKAGGAYVPLDPAYPADRLDFMMSDASAPVLITEERHAGAFASDESRRVILLDKDETLARESAEDLRASASHGSLCYVLYTSGSTGRPKGVAMSHGPLANLVCWQRRRSEGARVSRTLQFAPLSFDVSFQEIFSTLCTGGTLVLIEEQERRDPTELWPLLAREAVERLFLPFIALQQLAEVADSQADAQLCLRQVVTAGEQLRVTPQVVSMFRRLAGCTLDNQYGPTEAHVVTSFMLEGAPSRWTSLPPIGRPVSNAEIYLLDARLNPVPVGVAGELHIGGGALARGYLNRPDMTAERFVPHPFANVPGARLYKTRDLARFLAEGDVEFNGRADNQVKVRGFRVEPGEIEAALGTHASLKDVAVTAREDEPGHKRLVAYYVAHAGRAVEASELRAYLKERLPEYMVPSAFVALDALPLTPSGKVDRGALPAPGHAKNDSAKETAAPRTPAEELLASIWAEVLRVERVGVYDNFFELGGDSILTIQVVARAAQAGLRIVPKQLFQHQTIAGLASVAGTSPLVESEQGAVVGPLPLLPIQHWFFEQQSPEPHHFNMGYFFEADRRLDSGLLEKCVRALVTHHDALRLRFRKERTGWQQFNADVEEAVPFRSVDLSALDDDERHAAALEEAARQHVSLDLTEGPLLRVVHFDCGEGRSSRVLFIIHHLAVDGVSWRILLEDLQTAYRQLEEGAAVRLPQKTTSFKRWAERMDEHAQKQSVRDELTYWLAEARGHVAPLPVDNPEGANTEGLAQTIVRTLEAAETGALLREMLKNSRVRINDVLLTALARAFERWTGSPRLLVDVEGHGREEIVEGVDLTRTVGWFTSICPLLLETDALATPDEALNSVKEQIRRLPNRGLGHGLLRYMCRDASVGESLRALPRAEVSFNYLGQFDQLFNETAMFSPARHSTGQIASPRAARPHLLYVNGFVYQGQLYMKFTFSTDVYRAPTVETLAESFMDELRALIRHCRDEEVYLPSDFALAQVTRDELEEALARVEFEGEEV